MNAEQKGVSESRGEHIQGPSDIDAPVITSWSQGFLQPRAFLAALISGRAQAAWMLPVGMYFLATLLLVREVLFRSAFLWQIAPGSTWRRTSEAMLQHVRDDVYLWCGIWAFSWVAGRWIFAHPLSPRRRIVLFSALFWPLAIGKWVGLGLSLAGHDLWWMPHHPVRSWVIVEQGQVIGWRYALKCLVSYGISAWMLLVILWEAKRVFADPDPKLTQSETRAPSLFLKNVQSAANRKAAKTMQGAGMILVLATCGAGAWDLYGAAQGLRPLLPGDPLPDRDLPLLIPEKNRRSIATADLRGKILVLDFWASWCLPCRRSIPEISHGLAEAYPGQVVVLGVNQERDRKAARDIWQSLKPRFESAMDPGSWGHRMGISSLPTTLVVDATGTLRHMHIGYTEIEVLQREVEALLSNKSP